MPAYAPRRIDFEATARRFRTLPDESLRWIVADCRAAIDAMPDGANVPAYEDEIHVAHAELRRRSGADRCPTCHRPR